MNPLQLRQRPRYNFNPSGIEAEDFRLWLPPRNELLVQQRLCPQTFDLAGEPGFCDQLAGSKLLDPLGDREGLADLEVGPAISRRLNGQKAHQVDVAVALLQQADQVERSGSSLRSDTGGLAQRCAICLTRALQ